MALLLCWFLFAVIVATVADRKGRSVTPWAWYGLLLGPIALVHILVASPNAAKVEADAVADGTMRKCPACAELVRSEAQICRFCHTRLEPILARQVVASPTASMPSERSNQRTGYIVGAAAVTLVGVLIAAWPKQSESSAVATAPDRSELIGACADRGVRYFQSIGSFPRLSDGRDARSELSLVPWTRG